MLLVARQLRLVDRAQPPCSSCAGCQVLCVPRTVGAIHSVPNMPLRSSASSCGWSRCAWRRRRAQSASVQTGARCVGEQQRVSVMHSALPCMHCSLAPGEPTCPFVCHSRPSPGRDTRSRAFHADPGAGAARGSACARPSSRMGPHYSTGRMSQCSKPSCAKRDRARSMPAAAVPSAQRS